MEYGIGIGVGLQFGGGVTPAASPLAIASLPTSSAGLATGDVWNDSGTLKIV